MGPNFFEEAGSPLGPPPALPGEQPSTPAIPADLAPPAPAAPAPALPDRVPTWADTLAELPEYEEEPAPQPAAAQAPPAPAAPPQYAPQPPAALDATAIGTAVVNGLLGAAQAREQQQQFGQQTAAALAMPPLDRERALVDGAYLDAYLAAHAEVVQRRTQAAMGPAFNQAAAMARIGPAVLEGSVNIARSEAARLMKERHGMDTQRFNELVPMVHAMIDENPDPAARVRFLVNPEAWVMGANVAHQNSQGGVPVQRTAPPPAVGGGGAPAAGSTGGRAGITPMMAMVERQLGRPGLFKKEHVEKVREMAAMGGTRGARSA
jgi:hypothetical protein